MERPMGRKNNMRTSEEKEKIVLEYLNGRVGYKTVARSYNIHPSRFFIWVKNYREKGIIGRPKQAETREEELERENIKLKIEIERLKKGYYVKGVGQRKEYVSINNRSTKSSEN